MVSSLYNACIDLPSTVSDEQVPLLLQALEEGPFLSHAVIRDRNRPAKPWVLYITTERKPDKSELVVSIELSASGCGIDLSNLRNNPVQIESTSEKDWLALSYRQNPPVMVSPFFVSGTHYKESIPEQYISLKIDAITAFGSGDHGTTKGCLQAMAMLDEQGVCPWNTLDMGTGSGILALAAWKLWKSPVLGVDIDDGAIEVCVRHAAQNRVSLKTGEVVFKQGDGFSADIVAQKKPFELIVANILAGPLKAMAYDLKAACDENGYVILSGILNEQADDVRHAYEAEGLTFKDQIEIDEWSTLIMQNIYTGS